MTMPFRVPWLLTSFMGYQVAEAFYLTPPLLLLQLYVVSRYWKKGSFSLTHVALSSLLVLFMSSFQYAYRFIWASPFLSAYYGLGRVRGLYALVFASAFLFGVITDPALAFLVPYVFTQTSQPALTFLFPLVAGAFYGVNCACLLKLNLDAMKRIL